MPNSVEVAARAAAGLPIPKRARLPYSVLVYPQDRVDIDISLILPLLLVFMRYLSIASAFSGVNNELYLQIDFGWNRRRLYRHRILPAALQIGIRCQASKDIPL